MIHSLYKYCDDTGIQIFKTGKIKFTPPGVFNDPFDLYPDVVNFNEKQRKAVLKGVVKFIYANNQHPLARRIQSQYKMFEFEHRLLSGTFEPEFTTRILNVDLPKMARQRLEELRQNTGILCLSADRENHAMWAYYGKDHTGMVIEFDATHRW